MISGPFRYAGVGATALWRRGCRGSCTGFGGIFGGDKLGFFSSQTSSRCMRKPAEWAGRDRAGQIRRGLREQAT